MGNAPWEALVARVTKLEERLGRRDELLIQVSGGLGIIRRELTQLKQSSAHDVGDLENSIKQIERRLDEHARALTETILE